MPNTSVYARRAAAMASVPPGGSVNLGNPANVRFDGSQSFSLGIWINVDAQGATTPILSQAAGAYSAFTLGLAAGVPYFQMAGLMAPVKGSSALPPGSHYVVVTYAASAPGTGQITLYVDYAVCAQSSGSNLGTASTSPVLVGGSVQQYVWCVSLYNIALSPSQCGCDWTPGQAMPGLVACFCLGMVPPMESVSGQPFSFQGGAAQTVQIPCTYFTASSWVQPAPQSPVALPAAVFSVQAWCQPNSSAGLPMTVVCSGNQDVGQAVALSVLPATVGSGFVACVQVGMTTLQGGTLSSSHMSNLAATCDGTTLTLYVNGISVASQACGARTVGSGSTLVGASAQVAVPGVVNTFQGYIQTVDLWSICLSAAQVQQYMQADPSAVTGCLASYDLYCRPLDGVTQLAMLAVGSPQLVNTYQLPPVGVQQAPVARQVQPWQEGAAVEVQVPSMVGQLSDQQIEHWVGELQAFLAPHGASMPDAALATQLRTRLQGLAQGNHPQDGHIVFNRRVGADWVFYHHHNGKTVECLRLSAATTDSCMAWYISVILTLILAILSLFGVSMSSSRFSDAVVRWVNRYPALVRAFCDTMQGEVTARTLLTALRLLMAGDALTSLLWDVAGSMSWWELLFLGLSLVLTFIEIVFPNPSTAAWAALKLGQLVLAAAQLIVLFNEKPQGC